MTELERVSIAKIIYATNKAIERNIRFCEEEVRDNTKNMNDLEKDNPDMLNFYQGLNIALNHEKRAMMNISDYLEQLENFLNDIK